MIFKTDIFFENVMQFIYVHYDASESMTIIIIQRHVWLDFCLLVAFLLYRDWFTTKLFFHNKNNLFVKHILWDFFADWK